MLDILAQTVPVDDNWFKFMERYGVPMAMVVGFCLWSYFREKGLTTRLQTVEDFMRTTLVDLVTDTKTQMSRVADVIGKCERK